MVWSVVWIFGWHRGVDGVVVRLLGWSGVNVAFVRGPAPLSTVFGRGPVDATECWTVMVPSSGSSGPKVLPITVGATGPSGSSWSAALVEARALETWYF